MLKIAPSILAADFSMLAEEVKCVDALGADYIHIDVMDGHFVPNITLGPGIVKCLRPHTTLPFDVHLMIEEPDQYIKEFVEAGADIITVHVEACRHLHRTLQLIKQYNIACGVVLNPHTPLEMIKHVLNDVDWILVMSVNPGFGGQSFIPYSLDKIREVKQMAIEANNEDILIQVDGGIDSNNVKDVVEAGANVIVAGSAVFKNGNIEENIKALRG